MYWDSEWLGARALSYAWGAVNLAYYPPEALYASR